MIPWPIKIGLGAVAALVLVVSAMFVLQLGPFNHRPSVAAKAIPKVVATVAATQTQAATAVTAAEVKTTAAAVETQKRIEVHVVQIREAPDRSGATEQFYRSVCDTQLYGGSADCRGFRSQPEGGGPALGAGAVRPR